MQLDQRREIGSSSSATSAAADTGKPGKATNTAHLPAASLDELKQRVAEKAGTQIEDERGFRFVATSEGWFSIAAAPLELAQTVGYTIAPVDQMTKYWMVLAGHLAAPKKGQQRERITRNELDDGAASFVQVMAGSRKDREGNLILDVDKKALTLKQGSETTQVNDDGSRKRTFDTVDREGGVGSGKGTTKVGNAVEIVDMAATRKAVKKELEDELERAEQEGKNLEKEHKNLAKEDQDPAALKEKLRRLEERKTSLQRSIDRLEKYPNSADALKHAYIAHRLKVEPKYRVVAEDSVTETDKYDYTWWQGKIGHVADKTATTTDDGKMTASTNKSSWSASAADGKIDWSSGPTESVTGASGKKTTRTPDPTSASSIVVGAGAATHQNTETRSRQTTNAAGDIVSGGKVVTGSDASIVANDQDGTGFKSGTSKSVEATKDGVTHASSRDAHVGYTDKGVIGDASRTQKLSNKNYEGTVKVGLNGGLTIDVIPPTDPDGAYKLVTTLRAGASAVGTAGTAKKEGADAEFGAQGSGSASFSVGGSIVYTHVLSLAEVQSYLDAANAAEAGRAAKGESAKFPDIDVIAKMKMVVSGQQSIDSLMADTAQGAAALPAGDSITTIGSATVSGKLSGRYNHKKTESGTGDEASGELGYTRTMTITRDKDGKVIITVSFVESDKLAGSVSGSLVGATLKVGASHAGSDGDSVTFQLDPTAKSYDQAYEKIQGVVSRDALRALRTDPDIKVASRTHTASHKDGATFGAESPLVSNPGGAMALGFGMESGTSHEGSSSITLDDKGASGTVSGSRTNDFKFTGAFAAGASRTDGAASTVGTDGTMTTNLMTRSAESSPSTTIDRLGKTVKGWLGIEDDQDVDPKKVLKGAFAKTPGERVRELLEKQWERLAGYNLSQSDIDVLLERAEDQHKWLGACVSPRAIAPMRTLRTRLLDPDVDKSLVPDENDITQIDKAVKLARAKALADFMETSGSYGMEALVNVLRNYGATFGRDSVARDIGERYEWPESLAKEHALYDKTVAASEVLTGKFDTFIAQPDGLEQWRQRSEVLVDSFDKVRAALIDSHDIRSERARAEMIDDISARRAALKAGENYFQRAQSASSARSPMPVPTAEQDQQAALQMLANERIPTLLADLAQFKARERVLFAAATQASVGGDNVGAHRILGQLRDLYEFWVTRVVELRGAYQAANIPTDQWQVSKAGDPKKRTSSTEPYADGMIRLWQESGGEANRGQLDWAAEWKQRFTTY